MSDVTFRGRKGNRYTPNGYPGITVKKGSLDVFRALVAGNPTKLAVRAAWEGRNQLARPKGSRKRRSKYRRKF